MPAPLSADLRTRLAGAVRGGTSAAEAARRFAVHPTTVRRLLRRQRATGSLAPLPHRSGPPRRLSADDDRRITALVDAQCDLTLAEIADGFEAATGRRISRATVTRSLARSGYTRKKKR